MPWCYWLPWEFCSWKSSWSTSSRLNTNLCSWSTDLAGPVANSGTQSQAVTNVTPCNSSFSLQGLFDNVKMHSSMVLKGTASLSHINRQKIYYFLMLLIANIVAQWNLSLAKGGKWKYKAKLQDSDRSNRWNLSAMVNNTQETVLNFWSEGPGMLCRFSFFRDLRFSVVVVVVVSLSDVPLYTQQSKFSVSMILLQATGACAVLCCTSPVIST